MEITFSYSPWYLVPAALLIGLGLFFYYFRKPEYTKSQIWTLAALRFFGLLLLCFFLLKPQIVEREVQALKPRLVFLEDVSRSMRYHQDSLALDSILEAWPAQSEDQLSKYQLFSYVFANTLDADSVDEAEFTNIYQALNEVQSRFYGEPLAATVLLTDGIYNQGRNPLQNAAQANAPLYILKYGNQEQANDIGIEALRYNKSVSLGRKLSLEIDLAARNAAGSSFKLEIRNVEKQLVHQANFTVNREDWLESLIVEIAADEEGLQSYSLAIIQATADANPSNDQREIAFEVRKEAYAIWIYSPQSHPDVAAIRRAIQSEANWEIHYCRNRNELDLTEARVLLAFDWDESLVQEIRNQKVPTLFIAGSQSNLRALHSLGLGKGLNPHTEEQYALNANALGLFALDAEQKALFPTWPPIEGLYGNLEVPAWAEVVLYKQIGNVQSNEALAISGSREGQRLGLLAGRGFWSWRMYNVKNEKQSRAFDQFFRRWVQYLQAQEREEPLQIEFEKELYERSPSRVIAKLYNPGGNLVNEPDLSLKLSGANGETYDYRFSRESNLYRLKLDGLSPGLYSYTASTRLGDRSYEKGGRIWVQENSLEQQDLRARREMLDAMASQSGGKAYELKDWPQMLTDLAQLEAPQQLNEHKIKRDLLTKWELFFVALVFLSLEWFLRKYWGRY